MRQMDEKITGNIWTRDDIFRNYQNLCLKFRGRFSGSDDARQAADYIENCFRSYNLDTVTRDWFDLAIWERGSVELSMVSPRSVTFPCISLPYSPGCDHEYTVVDLGMGHPADIAGAGSKLKDQAVMVSDINPPEGPHLHRLQKYILALEAGAGAFIFIQKTPGMLAPTGSIAFNQNGDLNQVIPSIGIPAEVAAEIREWAIHEPVRIRLVMDNSIRWGKDSNVIGELKGNENSDETVIVCGHYDGHDIAQGAVDNASGTAVVMEAARVLAPLKADLKRNVRFILFGSEEMGLLGSSAYARRVDPSAIRFVFNLDCVGDSSPLTMMLQNSSNLTETFRGMINELPADIDLEDRLIPFSDHFPFLLKGIPSAFCVTHGSGGRGWGHTIADTFEKVRRDTLMRVASHVSRLIYRVANAEDWCGEVVDSEMIRRSLEPSQIDILLKYEGLWSF